MAALPLAFWEGGSGLLPPGEVPPPVWRLLDEARIAGGAERASLAARLNVQLEALAARGGSRQVADTFHRLLESGRLEGLVDPEGRACRTAAVEGLLSLGFPYALEVRPEDLEHLQAASRLPWETPWRPVAACLVLGAGLIAQGWRLPPAGGPGRLGEFILLMGLALLALGGAVLGPGRSLVGRGGLAGLAAVSLLGLYLGASEGYSVVGGVAGLLACLLLIRPQR